MMAFDQSFINEAEFLDLAMLDNIISNAIFTEEDDWNVVISECSSLAAKWEQLSAFLGLRMSRIDIIKQNHPGNNVGCWNDAIKHWIKQDYNTRKFGLPSWKSLLTAVAQVEKLRCKNMAAEHQKGTLSYYASACL